MLKAKFKAFFIHLCGSAALALCAIALVYGLWYPGLLAKAVGVTEIFLLLLCVDVVLGPLLTFAVFRTGKKSLRFDLGAIIALQLAAFGYGIWTVAEGRPAWVVLNIDQFDVIRAHEIDTRELAQAAPQYRSPSWFGPQWVHAKAPEDSSIRDNIKFEAIFAGLRLTQRPQYYSTLSFDTQYFSQAIQPIDALSAHNSPEAIAKLKAVYPGVEGYIPLYANSYAMVVLINRKEPSVLRIHDLRPW